MRITKHIISTVLIILFLLNGLPVFSPDDANRDIRVDLKDAILQVKNFVRTAEEPHTFAARVEKALSALNVVAGLKTVIKQAKDKNSSTGSMSLDLPCLITLYSFAEPLYGFSQVHEEPVSYKSLLITPDSPPPRAGCLCA